ncbi:hypothetical protein E2C01_021384 [Portunus trituberculatus]|uniref:Uncharacterized protein n=1 Tax=Portunus trituberculatus TaxID=210409 RepID=A0A5B7E348_PORTR|nr:hypothetical protein [Portunus trituberculatus]
MFAAPHMFIIYVSKSEGRASSSFMAGGGEAEALLSLGSGGGSGWGSSCGRTGGVGATSCASGDSSDATNGVREGRPASCLCPTLTTSGVSLHLAQHCPIVSDVVFSSSTNHQLSTSFKRQDKQVVQAFATTLHTALSSSIKVSAYRSNSLYDALRDISDSVKCCKILANFPVKTSYGPTSVRPAFSNASAKSIQL